VPESWLGFTLSVLSLFLVGLTFQSPAPPDQPSDDVGRAYYLFIQGRQLEGRNDIEGAIVSYRQALDILPQAAVIRVELAGLYAQQGQIQEARTQAEAALASDGDNRDAHRLLGWIQAATLARVPAANRDAAAATAASHLERAITAGANDAATVIALASLYVRQRDTGRAEPLLGRLLDEEPGLPPALRLQALTLHQLGRSREAALLVARLRSGPPDAVEQRVRQIERLERMGQWRDAAAGWVEVLGRSDGGALYRSRYARALAQTGSFDTARTVLTEATRDAPRDPSVWYLVAQVETRAERDVAAEQASRRIMEIDPTDLRGPLSLAELRASKNDFRGVVRALERPLENVTDDAVESGFYAVTVNELSRAFNKLGETRQAVALVEGARRRAPDDEGLRFLLASTYQHNKQFDAAERVYREILAEEPTNAGALNDLGYMLADRGDRLPEAVDLVTRALAVDPDNPAFLDSLGWAYFRLNRFDEALDPLERAAAALPEVSVIQDHAGDLYFSLKRYRDAADAFGRALEGDRDGIDVGVVTRKRNKARELATASE
jgi:tetratricopeptide (TPR) repeat protein